MRVVALCFCFLLFLLPMGCRKDSSSANESLRRRGDETAATGKRSVVRNSPLVPLLTPHHKAFATLRAYRFVATSELTRTGDDIAAKSITQRVEIVVDRDGHFVARHDTHQQYGTELIWDGNLLYHRLRYNPFTSRRPTDDLEPNAKLNVISGLLGAYIRLLQPYLLVSSVKIDGSSSQQRLRFSLSSKRTQPDAANKYRSAPSRQWRNTIVATAIEGTALVEGEATVSVKLTAQWTFTPPQSGPLPESGIPQRSAKKRTATMSLSFSQSVERLAEEPTISPPPSEEVIQHLERNRLEIERQMVTGERLLIPRWGVKSLNVAPRNPH